MSLQAGKDILDSDTDDNKSTTTATAASTTITAATALTATNAAATTAAAASAPFSLPQINDFLGKIIQQQLFERIREMLAQVTSLEQQRDALQSEIKQLGTSHQEDIDKREQQHEDVRQKYIADFSAALEEANRKKNDLEKENGQLLAKMEQEKSEKTSMEQKQTSQAAEIKVLRKQVEEQERRRELAAKELSETQEKLTEAQKAAADVDAALKQRAATEELLRSEMNALQKRLKDFQSQGEKSKKMLDKIKGFVAQPVDMTTEALAGEFDAMWTRCLNFVNTVVKENLSQEVLENKSTWHSLEEFVRVPLPQSNTPCAKSMRAIVILWVLAKALTRYIFTSTYLLSEAGELDDVLNELAEKDSSHERFVRSVLLRPLADREATNITTRAEKVRKNVVPSVMSIIPPAQLGGFESGLQSLVESTARTWTKFQNNKTHFRVSCEMDKEIEQSAEWKALKLPIDMNNTFEKALQDDHPVVVLFPQLFSVDQEDDMPIRPAITVVSSQLREAEEENRVTKVASAARRSSGTGMRPRTRSRLSDPAQNSGAAMPGSFLGNH